MSLMIDNYWDKKVNMNIFNQPTPVTDTLKNQNVTSLFTFSDIKDDLLYLCIKDGYYEGLSNTSARHVHR